MRTLQQHIAEKLVINKNFVSSNDGDYKFINNLIDKYVDFNDYLNCDNVRGAGVLFNDLAVSLSGNGLDKEFSEEDKRKCKEYADEMFKFGNVYRFVYSPMFDDNATSMHIIKMFDEIQKSDIEFEEIFFDMDKGYSIECYETDKYMIFTCGMEKYSYLYISTKD